MENSNHQQSQPQSQQQQSERSTAAAAAVNAARHICQEARVVLTSLRGGPPHVARGELAQDLMELRDRVPRTIMEATINGAAAATAPPQEEQEAQAPPPAVAAMEMTRANGQDTTTAKPIVEPNEQENAGESVEGLAKKVEESCALEEGEPVAPPNVESVNEEAAMLMAEEDTYTLYARPFLQVVMDPRASGPYTLVALRAIYRLLEDGTFRFFNVSFEALAESVLSCKFEQTDAANDEAVEIAIANVLSLLIQLDHRDNGENNNIHVRPETLMDAFNTIFETHTTFVHSPALTRTIEDVLSSLVTTIFQRYYYDQMPEPARLVLEFLASQLLHTPLVGGDVLDESMRDAQITHDATRVLCLRLVRIALRIGWDDGKKTKPIGEEDTSMLQIIQDDLCLSLLMTGQAIWAYHDAHTNISPGFVSLEVLSEICSTLSVLWNTLSLREHLIVQFETILTGFYTRALVLLRKRKQATNSVTFNANLIFDAEVEIILESLVDIFCLHDHSLSIADGDGGALETMFAYYDCNMDRSDVALGLMMELCRCCGGTVNEDGEEVLTPSNSVDFQAQLSPIPANSDSNNNSNADAANKEDGTPTEGSSTINTNDATDDQNKSDSNAAATPSQGTPSAPRSSSLAENSMIKVEHPWRQVPAHLKELCAQALMGGMKCLFRDDKASAETIRTRANRKRSIMSGNHPGMEAIEQSLLSDPSIETNNSSQSTGTNGTGHFLRYIKSKKRMMRKAARLFNKKSSLGLSFLVDSGLIPDSLTPKHVALFLRNGLVVGLDKKEVGAYLGEAGKSPQAGKSPPSWERDWFHKEVLTIYCSLFKFQNQSLVDGLRMFLAAFRLPGEAQQIDRILQAFSDSCGKVCAESSSGSMKLFSDDPKKASDCAYLLAFSIIMLNTDRHNANIREDRKMSVDDFVKNNTDYGRDITDKGKELPREYLEGIYHSINDEEIRTEGEGADGAMTVERWKDVLRGSSSDDQQGQSEIQISVNDAEDLTELVLEHVWKPIMSAIGAFWVVTARSNESEQVSQYNASDGASQSGMLGVQGARLGMDMSLEMLNGVRKLGRMDIFRKIFTGVCEYTGLLGENYYADEVERALLFTNSVEAQSAVVVACRSALDAGEGLDEDGWKRVWAMLFELRDLKMIQRGAGMYGTGKSILSESDPDLLNSTARNAWTMCLVRGDMEFDAKANTSKPKAQVGLLGAFGRAIFGSDDDFYEGSLSMDENDDSGLAVGNSAHGKENLVVWDERAPSDDEGDSPDYTDGSSSIISPGAQFEGLLIQESLNMSRQMETTRPVTGLERADETRTYQASSRARVRERLRQSCNFKSLACDSRFMEESCVGDMLKALVGLVSAAGRASDPIKFQPPSVDSLGRIERSSSDATISSGSSYVPIWHDVPLSPASEALAEVIICEIVLKNRNRFKALWTDLLQDHYMSRLTSVLVNPPGGGSPTKIPVNPGLEKRVTGLIRLCVWAMQREDMANEVLSTWKYVLPINNEQRASSPLRALDRHMGEGLWRIVAQVDGLMILDQDGWEGLLALVNWCAIRGASLKPLPWNEIGGPSPGLPEDDPALQSYRSLHLLLNTKELDGKVPCSILESLRTLTHAGQKRKYPQLSIASLDLLKILHDKKIASAQTQEWSELAAKEAFWATCWRKIVEAITETARSSSDSSVRQHSLSMVTNLLLDSQANIIPINHLCDVLGESCVPVAGTCICQLQSGDAVATSTDELMIEFDLCVGLIFKPLRQHLKNVVDAGDISSTWKSVLGSLEKILKPENTASSPTRERHEVIPPNLKSTMNDRISEHLQNAVMNLVKSGVVRADPKSPGDITEYTWESVSRMGINESVVKEWKEAAMVT